MRGKSAQCPPEAKRLSCFIAMPQIRQHQPRCGSTAQGFLPYAQGPQEAWRLSRQTPTRTYRTSKSRDTPRARLPLRLALVAVAAGRSAIGGRSPPGYPGDAATSVCSTMTFVIRGGTGSKRITWKTRSIFNVMPWRHRPITNKKDQVARQHRNN